jgi:peptide/nickel transport system substrate-binding protein
MQTGEADQAGSPKDLLQNGPARPHAILGGVLSLTVLITGASCRPAESVAPKSITIAYCCDHRIWGPYWDMPAKFLMFQPLAAYDQDGELVGRLAESWDHSADYRTWTIHLRTDVRWHDGVPFTAHDVQFTYELVSHPDVLAGSPRARTVRVLDDSTFTVQLHRAGIEPLDWWQVFYPKHVLEHLDPEEYWKWDFWSAPIGNGPYRYVRHIPFAMTELEANPDYYRDQPRIARAVIKYVEGTALTELMAGNVDALGWAGHSDVAFAAADERLRTYNDLWVGQYVGVLWSHRHPALRDRRVRRALTLAIDREELHRVISLPSETPVFDTPFTLRQYRRGDIPNPLPHDPEQARTLLDATGWRDGDVDGVRERAGEPFRFSLLISGEEAEEAVYIQEQLRRIGVHVEIEQLALPLVRRRRRAGDFDAVIRMGGWDLSGLDQHYGAESSAGYREPTVAAILDSLRNTWSPVEQDRLFGRLMPIFQRDMPMTYLYPQVTEYVAHRRVRGLESPNRAAPVENLEYLWIEEHEQR